MQAVLLQRLTPWSSASRCRPDRLLALKARHWFSAELHLTHPHLSWTLRCLACLSWFVVSRDLALLCWSWILSIRSCRSLSDHSHVLTPRCSRRILCIQNLLCLCNPLHVPMCQRLSRTLPTQSRSLLLKVSLVQILWCPCLISFIQSPCCRCKALFGWMQAHLRQTTRTPDPSR